MILDARNESSQHRDAKLRIAAMAKRNGGVFIVAVDVGDRFSSGRLDVSDCTVVVECSDLGEEVPDPEAYFERTGSFPLVIYDVGFVHDGRVVAAIEVMRTSGIKARKRERIIRAGVLCLAVKANLAEWYVDDSRIEAVQVIAPPNATRHLEQITSAGTR